MGAVLGSMNYVLEKLRETAIVMMGDNFNYVIEIAKEILDVRLRFGKGCIGMVLDEVFPPLQHFGKILMAKVVEFFPTEITVAQMTHWVQVVAPYIIGAVVILVILLWFFRGGRGGSPGIKIMIAPGTSRTIKIPRPSFEASPKLYFRGLRGK